ncbi:hypothetical protein HMPREF1199_01384 [Hoylesella oralis CC98A]|nr:hypothetical protein HMPREF1199_01384 [Hoylesella oralis CC98A]
MLLILVLNHHKDTNVQYLFLVKSNLIFVKSNLITMFLYLSVKKMLLCQKISLI